MSSMNIDPIKHPKRWARQQEAIMAERIRALAPSLTISTISLRVGVSRMECETLCARHAIPFKVEGKK